jgi:ArsR family transcriptional regulator
MKVSQKDKKAARKIKAVSHPARLALVKRLLRKKCCVGDIQECLSVSQPNLSQHLRILKNEGIIIGERFKTKICYRVVDDQIKQIMNIL